MRVTPLGDGRYLVSDGDHQRLGYAVAGGDDTWVFLDGNVYVLETRRGGRASGAGTAGGESALAAPMPATVVAVHAEVGRAVEPGDLLIVLEAMKMELTITAPRGGRVARIACRPGELVQPGVPLLELE